MWTTPSVLAFLASAAVLISAQERTLHYNSATRNSARLAKAVNGTDDHFFDVLKHLMVPRVVGTPSHERVKEFIVGEMKRLGWQVERDPFKANTPTHGVLQFENIIAKINPSAKKVLVLACHYDSKYFGDIEFLGATDSAVPCAMIINLAQSLKNELSSLKGANLGLEMWFFDGEEAFLKWGPSDSIYGARHLADKMQREDTLRKINLLVLLDLLGSAGPYFYNYYPESQNAYRILAAGERVLDNHQHLKAVATRTGASGLRLSYFQDGSVAHLVEDDHTPFLQRGVPVLHIIPHQFPNVWHTQYDNWNAIDRPTVDDLNKILRLFVLNYLNLS